MSLKLTYPNEKFLVAVDALATSDSPLKERIYSAWMSFHPLRESDFEGELKAKFAELMKKLTSRGPVIDSSGAVAIGSVQHTLEHCTVDELREIADLIFSMFVGIAREYYGAIGGELR